MSQENSTILRKSITMKQFGNSALKSLLVYDPATQAPPKDILVGTVIGDLSGATDKKSEWPDGTVTTSICLEGDFIALTKNPRTGEDDKVIQAGECYLPASFSTLAKGQLGARRGQESVQFGIEIWAVPDATAATGYKYMIVSKTAQVSPRMGNLLTTIAGKGVNVPQHLLEAAKNVRDVTQQLTVDANIVEAIGHDPETGEIIEQKAEEVENAPQPSDETNHTGKKHKNKEHA